VEFHHNMTRHLEHTAYNTIGLTEILAYRGPARPTTPATAAADRDRRHALRRVALVVLLPLVLLGIARRARGADMLESMALGIPALFVSLNLAAYYYALLLVLLLARARDHVRLAVLFGAEAVGYTLLLFEPSDVTAYFHYNLLILYVLIAMYLPVFSNDERQIEANPRDGAPSRTRATGALVDPGARC
jgi:hypothetical protein